MKKQYLVAMALASALLTLPITSFAQETAPPSVTLDLREVPIRTALEQIFNSARVDYSIAPTVQGYVNLKVTDISFENALKLILRSSTTPLTYSVVNGVYLVTPRTVSVPVREQPPIESMSLSAPHTEKHYEMIELTYADPADLAQLLNIQIIPVGTRWRGNGNGSGNGASSGGGNRGGAGGRSGSAGSGSGNGGRGSGGSGAPGGAVAY